MIDTNFSIKKVHNGKYTCSYMSAIVEDVAGIEKQCYIYLILSVPI